MPSIQELIKLLESCKRKVFWQGGINKETVKVAERILGVTLPISFQEFLMLCGGGGLINQEISGVEAADATIDNRGTLCGDTLRCRKEFGLLERNVVIYFPEDEIIWCLDTTLMTHNECPVVSFDSATKTNTKLFDSFHLFLEDYVKRRIG